MASSSSSSSSWRYDVFPSFAGADVGRTFISHLTNRFFAKGISIFQDNEIARGVSISRVIRESRISVVVLSKNYASSSWRLDELVEILKCKKEMGQIVMTIFYKVDTWDVTNQTGEFGNVFDQTCTGKTEEERQRWSQALNHVGNIAGEHSLTWGDKSEMIEKIASDVFYHLIKLSARETEEERQALAHVAVRDNESKMIKKIVRYVSNKLNAKRTIRYSNAMAFLVVISLLLEMASVVADQFSSIRKPYFARLSLVLSVLSLVLSILDLICKIRLHRARFRCKWPVPWFYYPSRGYNRIFGSFIDTVLLFCVVGQFIVSTINYSFTERRRDAPIKVSVWPIIFAIGMVVSKFMEKTPISKEN